MSKKSSKADQAVWDANRRKHEAVQGKSLPNGPYEDAYEWDAGSSVHARNRNERAAQQFGTIYGNTRPGDDWEYAGQTSGTSWRGKDGSGGSKPGTGIWKRRAPAPAPAPAPAAPAPAAPAPAPAPTPAPPAPAFDPTAFAAPQQQAAEQQQQTATVDPGPVDQSGRQQMPGRTISREGFDISPHIYNSYVTGQAQAFYDRYNARSNTRPQPEWHRSFAFGGNTRQRSTAIDDAQQPQQRRRFAFDDDFRAQLRERLNTAAGWTDPKAPAVFSSYGLT